MSRETQELVTLSIAVAGLLISLYLLYINIKNRGTQLAQYRISRHSHRSGRIVVQYVNTEQLEGRFLVKLVLFSLGSIASVIHSVAVSKLVGNSNRLLRLFKPMVHERIEDARWWPTLDESQKEPRYLDDNYRDLYVKDYRIILISVPGLVGEERYAFDVRTNNDYVTLRTHVSGIKGTHQFSHHYEEWHMEK